MDRARKRELLIKARDELKLHGWRRRDYGTLHGRKCPAGANLFALCGYPSGRPGMSPASDTPRELNMALVDVMTEDEKITSHVPGHPDGHLIHFNDNVAKSGVEVIALYDRAIKALED